MVFADEAEGQALQDITRFWQEVRPKAALPGICIHDLRDTFASLPASVGMTLPMIGKLSATCGFELRSASPTCSTIPCAPVSNSWAICCERNQGSGNTSAFAQSHHSATWLLGPEKAGLTHESRWRNQPATVT